MKAEQGGMGRRALEVAICLDDTVVEVHHLRRPGMVTWPADGQQPVAVRTDEDTYLVHDPALHALRELRPGEQVALDAAPARILVREVEDATPVIGAGLKVEGRVAGTALASVVAHLVFLGVIFAIPPDAKALVSWERYRAVRNQKYELAPTEDPRLKPQEPAEKQEPTAQPGAAEATAAHAGPTGTMGRPDSKAKGGRTAVAGEAPRTVLGAGTVQDYARNAGVLGALRSQAFSPLLDAGDTWGSEDLNAYGPALAGPPGDGPGTWGTGFTGTGPGGCIGNYCGLNTIGLGEYPTIGDSRGTTPWAKKPGSGPFDLRRPAGREPKPSIGKVTADDGGLDKEIVRRVIRQHLDEVRHCYERALLANPDLEGQVTVRFLIQPQGVPTAIVVSDAGPGLEGVGSCVVSSMARWQFPASSIPTKVTYPFGLHVAGR